MEENEILKKYEELDKVFYFEDSRKAKAIVETLKKRDHRIIFSDERIIDSPLLCHTAIRFAKINGSTIISPFNGDRTSLSEWKNSKSVSCESGIYAVPFEFLDVGNNIYFDIFNYFSLLEPYLFTLLEYLDEDVIYINRGVLAEVCIRRCNIVYSGERDDYLNNSELYLEKFRFEKLMYFHDIPAKLDNTPTKQQIKKELIK
jgi:hypothetical protein